MNRAVLMLRVTVRDGERAFLTRNGRFERVLEPGLHRLFDSLRRLGAEVFDTVRAEFPVDRYAVLKADHPGLAATLFETVENQGRRARRREPRRPAGAPRRAVDDARVLEGHVQCRCHAHRHGGRSEDYGGASCGVH